MRLFVSGDQIVECLALPKIGHAEQLENASFVLAREQSDVKTYQTIIIDTQEETKLPFVCQCQQGQIAQPANPL